MLRGAEAVAVPGARGRWGGDEGGRGKRKEEGQRKHGSKELGEFHPKSERKPSPPPNKPNMYETPMDLYLGRDIRDLGGA